MGQQQEVGSNNWKKLFARMSAEHSSLNSVLQAKLCKEIIRCVNYAAIKHRNMRREDDHQTPYINHLIDVTYILVQLGGISDVSVMQTALLHSTMEDTDTSFYELQAEFGEDVAKLVKELTGNKSLPAPDKRQELMAQLPHMSNRAKLVLLAKQLNMLREVRRSPPVGWSEQKVQEFFQSTHLFVAGLRRTNAAIEDSLDALFLERGIVKT